MDAVLPPHSWEVAMGVLRDVSVAGAAASLSALTTWWWMSPLETAADTASSAPVVIAVPVPVDPIEVPEAASWTPSEAEGAAPRVPSTAQEAAMQAVALASGEGLLRCGVSGLLDDGPVNGLGRAVVVDGVLTATVDDSAGEARVHRPGDAPGDPPAVVVRWWDAWPGEDGGCEVVPPTPVTVSGIVVMPDGSPAMGGEVGNLVDGIHPIAPDGGFTVECWLGATCAVAARHDRASGWGPFVKVVPDGLPIEDLVVVLQPPADPPGLADYLRDQVAELDRLAGQADPLLVALDDPTLDASARLLIQTWRVERDTERQELRSSLLAVVGPR